MAQFIEQTSLYEIFIRVQEDGSYGAFYQTITRFRRGEEIISPTLGPQVPLVQGDAEVFALLGLYVDAAAADTFAANQVLKARVFELEQAIEARGAEAQPPFGDDPATAPAGAE